MTKLVKVENDRSLVRDMSSGAILNTNIAELHKYRMRKLRIKSKEEEIVDLRNQVEELKAIVAKLIKE